MNSVRRLLSGLWRAITWLRLALANLVFLFLLLVLWLALRGSAPQALPDAAVLVLDPRGQVVDELSGPEPLALLGDAPAADSEVLLRDLIKAVDRGRDDPRVRALLLELDELLYIGQSKAGELAQAIARFRDSGKPVIAAGDYFSQDQYRLAAEADTLLMHPLGAVALEGYSYYQNYFAEALAKLSVTVHVFRAGDFKSIAEPFLRSDMSPGERQISERWLSVLWQQYTDSVEARRGLPSGSINDLLANYPDALRTQSGDAAALALSRGLVDELVDRQQRGRRIASLAGFDADEFPEIRFGDYLQRSAGPALQASLPGIALVTARGNMLPGEQEPGAIGGDSLAERLRDAASRPGVRALVLRLDTGGGSVFAAEIIREELARIRAGGLPVVVSMGSVAASGGYYVATAADRIVATPATLTGSIGVFLAFPTFDGLLERMGIGTDGVGTTSLAGALRPDRPLNPALSNTLQQSVDELYRRFVALVADGRGLSVDAVEAVAEGRVLAAKDALDAGLVDRLGGLAEALEEAASLAGVERYRVLDLQPAFSPRQQLLQSLGELLAGVPALAMLELHPWQALEKPSTALRGHALPGGAGWLRMLSETQVLLSGQGDPRNLYMRCLGCQPL